MIPSTTLTQLISECTDTRVYKVYLKIFTQFVLEKISFLILLILPTVEEKNSFIYDFMESVSVSPSSICKSFSLF